MNFGQLISIVRARRWAALSVFVLIVLTTVVISLILPKQYSGTASVVVDVKPDPISAVGFPSVVNPGFMATQVDILTSERVALRVIRDLKLLENDQIRLQWQEESNGKGTIEQWLIELLQKKLDVKPSRESNVISISYQSPDPKFAAGLANAFAQAYIATALELRVDPAKQFTVFFNSQTKDARDALERAQGKLSAFQQEKGIIAADERLDIENARLNELSSQLTQLQALAAESSSRQTQAQGTQGDRMQEVLNNPLIAGLKADLSRNVARLQELNARLGDNHPQVLELRANNEEVRSRIDAETRRITAGVGLTNTINRSRESQVRRELDLQRTKVLQMKAVRDEGLVLLREVENSQRIYDNLTARLSQTTLESQANQSYVNMLTVAQPPADYSSPKLVLNTALSIFLGGMLAVGVVLMLELMDRRVRDPEDVVAALGLPVIGTLPLPTAKRFVAGRRALPPAMRSSLALPAANTGTYGA